MVLLNIDRDDYDGQAVYLTSYGRKTLTGCADVIDRALASEREAVETLVKAAHNLRMYVSASPGAFDAAKADSRMGEALAKLRKLSERK